MYLYSMAVGTIAFLTVLCGSLFASRPLTAAMILTVLLLVGGLAGALYERKSVPEMIRIFGEERFYAMEAFAAYWVMGALLAVAFFIAIAAVLVKMRIV